MNLFRKIVGCALILLILGFLFGGFEKLAQAQTAGIKNEGENISRLTLSLNGKWQFEPSNKKPKTWHHFIIVPGLVDLAKPSIDWNSYKSFWYKKTFTLTPSQTRSYAFINIDQSKYGTEVWLNGKYLGSYIGCYTSHKYNATEAINYNGKNTLISKIGSKDNLPQISAVGHDYEKKSFFPGIWGDVSLILTGNPIIKRVQIVPHIDTHTAQAGITIKNFEKTEQGIILSSMVFEKNSGLSVSDKINTSCVLSALEEKTLILNLPISNMQLWSPGHPFLYKLVSIIERDGEEADRLSITFGMREFKIVGSDFYLNGQRIFLKGSNIAFHRFLSDPNRKDLPWNEGWIKKVLIDIPKEHNFNFFRFHLGHAYNKWYTIADEYGMLLQDEWAFWSITGREKQIKKEFTQWLYDNCNHPSIIIWDAMNEPHDDGKVSRGIIRDKIIPAMKKIDPTRPWECGLNPDVDFKSWKPRDFSEDHPYIYSKGPVLNKDNFGFSRSIEEMQNSNEPTILNEFVWFWLTKDGKPSSLMRDVLLRWLGRDNTNEQRLEYQARLVSDLCELFRRMDIDGIVPFVYLSNEGACTSNWFTGDIANPGVKPIMPALKDAFAPFGVSIELWDRHFTPGEKRTINVYLFNDTHQVKSGILNYKITNKDGSQVLFKDNLKVTVPAVDMRIEAINWTMPSAAGTYYLKAELIEGSEAAATSKKIAHVFEAVVPGNLSSAKLMVYDPDNEILNYLTHLGLNAINYDSTRLSRQDILILGEGALLSANYNSRLEEITSFVKKGHTLIVIEPSYGITSYKEKEYLLLADLAMAMNKREDKFEGGYDSYCFMENPALPLWNNIDEEHLKMFNGGWGGEVISQCDVKLNNTKLILAKSGLNLKYFAIAETIWGKGVVVISRLQLRGRLTEEADLRENLYSRRVDPIAQQYLLNLLSTNLDTAANWKRIKKILPFYIKKATASSMQDNNKDAAPEKAIDGNMGSRWSSEQHKDPQWIALDFGKSMDFSKIILHWENAYATAYKIQVSDDAKNWKTIYTEPDSDGGRDIINVRAQKARYLRIFGATRVNSEWGYSLWEVEVY